MSSLMEPPSPPSSSRPLPPPQSHSLAEAPSPIKTFQLRRVIAGGKTDVLIQTFDDRILVIVTQNEKVGILVCPSPLFLTSPSPQLSSPLSPSGQGSLTYGLRGAGLTSLRHKLRYLKLHNYHTPHLLPNPHHHQAYQTYPLLHLHLPSPLYSEVHDQKIKLCTIFTYPKFRHWCGGHSKKRTHLEDLSLLDYHLREKWSREMIRNREIDLGRY